MLQWTEEMQVARHHSGSLAATRSVDSHICKIDFSAESRALLPARRTYWILFLDISNHIFIFHNLILKTFFQFLQRNPIGCSSRVLSSACTVNCETSWVRCLFAFELFALVRTEVAFERSGFRNFYWIFINRFFWIVSFENFTEFYRNCDKFKIISANQCVSHNLSDMFAILYSVPPHCHCLSTAMRGRKKRTVKSI